MASADVQLYRARQAGKARVPLTALIELQLNVGKAEYIRSQEHFTRFRALSLAAIALAIAMGIAVGVWLIRSDHDSAERRHQGRQRHRGRQPGARDPGRFDQ